MKSRVNVETRRRAQPTAKVCSVPYRVLDLTDEKGLFCGKLLGDLGADVIKVERPGGDAARRLGPFYHDEPDPEKSLFWFAYNTSKRGITLNLESSDGRAIFRRLVKTADVVVESFSPGYLEQIGTGILRPGKSQPRDSPGIDHSLRPDRPLQRL